jgi:hypothetical protein
VTFLFTDIEGSTKLAQQYPDEMLALLARHHEMLHRSIQAHNGYVFQVVGGFLRRCLPLGQRRVARCTRRTTQSLQRSMVARSDQSEDGYPHR